MKILITGATGLIGKKLTADLLSKGYSVNYLTTRKSKIKSSNQTNGYYWDPEKDIIDLQCFKNVDTIINLAGSNIAKRWTKTNKLEILKSRIQSLILLRDSIVKNNLKIKKIISASAIGIFNGVSPNPITNKDFTIKLAKFLNRPLLLPKIPKWLMSLILGEMHIIIFESQNIACDRLNKTEFNFNFDNFDEAIVDLLK